MTKSATFHELPQLSAVLVISMLTVRLQIFEIRHCIYRKAFPHKKQTTKFHPQSIFEDIRP